MIYEITTLIGFIAAGTLGWMWNQSRQEFALLQSKAIQIQEFLNQEHALRIQGYSILETKRDEFNAVARDYAVLHTRHEETASSFV